MDLVNKSFVPLIFLLALLAQSAVATDLAPGWVPLFDGQSLEGWRASEHKESCRVEDGKIVVGGQRSHLFYSGPVDNHDFQDFALKLEVMTIPGSNSGVFFHTQFQETGWPEVGHEAQVNSTHRDWRRTGSIYAVQDLRETPTVDNQWFDYHIIVNGNRVTLKVNGKTVNEYTEDKNASPPADRPGRKLSRGTIALQAHDPGSTVYFRNIRIKTASTSATTETTTSSGCAICQPKSCCPTPCRRVAKRRCRQ